MSESTTQSIELARLKADLALWARCEHSSGFTSQLPFQRKCGTFDKKRMHVEAEIANLQAVLG